MLSAREAGVSKLAMAGQRRRACSSAATRHAEARGRSIVTVRWATDARYLAIEVSDQWGSLDPSVVGPRLASTRKHAPSEGGMGLPLVYACCNQFVVQVPYLWPSR